jgi:hypothetical protein
MNYSIVHNDEFSARLSMNSVIRLRGSAVRALTKNASPSSVKVGKLVGGITSTRSYERNVMDHHASTSALQTVTEANLSSDQIRGRNPLHAIRGVLFLFGQAISCLINTPKHRVSSTAAINYELGRSRMVAGSEGGKRIIASCSSLDVPHCEEAINAPHRDDRLREDDLYEFGKGCIWSHSNNGSELISYSDNHTNTISTSEGQSPEVYLPGLVIHIVPVKKGTSPMQKAVMTRRKNKSYKALIADRRDFMDLVVTPRMFLDHLPWRYMS